MERARVVPLSVTQLRTMNHVPRRGSEAKVEAEVPEDNQEGSDGFAMRWKTVCWYEDGGGKESNADFVSLQLEHVLDPSNS
jgi:hypothetical protein